MPDASMGRILMKRQSACIDRDVVEDSWIIDVYVYVDVDVDVDIDIYVDVGVDVSLVRSGSGQESM